MRKQLSIARRRAKGFKPFKLVIYLSKAENAAIERAAAITGKSKSAFGAEIIVKQAQQLLGTQK